MRLPNPLSQSANTTRPLAIAFTCAPVAERMNSPFQVTPPSARGPPKRFASSPRTGKLKRPFSDEKGLPSVDASGKLSLLRGPAGLEGLEGREDAGERLRVAGFFFLLASIFAIFSTSLVRRSSSRLSLLISRRC